MKHHLSAVLAAAAVMAVPMSANALVYQFNATINSTQEVPVNATTAAAANTAERWCFIFDCS